MAPHLRGGAVISIRASRYYWPGDVIAFSSPNGQLLVHRVIGYRPGPGGLKLVTQADASDTPDAPVSFAGVIGKTGPIPASLRIQAAGRFLRLVLRYVRKRVF